MSIDPTAAASDPPESHYRALSPLAVVSVALAVLSITTALHWALAVIPLAGILFGWLALKQMRKAPDEWTGRSTAQVGIGLSAGFMVFGLGWLIFAKASEIPYGYQLISYDTLQPDPMKPTEPIPQSALDMQDRKVFIHGFMQPRRQQSGIKEFILCPASGDCPFCTPDPKPTEMLRIVCQGDLETNFTTHEVGVAGRFRVNLDDPGGIPYSIDADLIR